jgi:hypothetical protein
MRFRFIFAKYYYYEYAMNMQLYCSCLPEPAVRAGSGSVLVEQPNAGVVIANPSTKQIANSEIQKDIPTSPIWVGASYRWRF